MKTVLCVLAAFVLSGCASCPNTVVREPVEVITPVAVRCKVKYPTPPTPVDVASLGPGVYDRTMAFLQEGNAYRLYSRELEAVLKKCADLE